MTAGGDGWVGALRAGLSGRLPRTWMRRVGGWLRRVTRRPPVGRVRPERLWDTRPVSRDWGFDRGKPVDRWYIERFLARHAADVRGRVIEVDTDRYTRAFGGGRVRRGDVLALEPGARAATLVGDLADGRGIPEAAFDCAIVTQTVQLIYEVHAAVDTLHRILKPGGVALVTAPGISKMTAGEDDSWGYCWGLTSRSARRLFEERFPGGRVEVQTFGNVLSAVAFLHGMAAEELSAEELEHRDPEYEVVVAVRAERAAG